MDRDSAVALIASRLGNRGTALNAQIILELQAAQEELEGLPGLPWFLLFHDTSLTMVANVETLTVPSGFLLEDDYSRMFLIGTDGGYRTVTKSDYDTLRGSSFLTGSGYPEKFALQGNTVHFFPTPNVAYALDWHYYKAADVLTTNIENAWLASAGGVLINFAGMRIARFLRDQQAVTIFKEDYLTALDRLNKHDEARRQAALDAFLGG